MSIPEFLYWGNSLNSYNHYIAEGGFYGSWKPVFTDSFQIAKNFADGFRQRDLDKYYFWAHCDKRDRVYGVVLKVRVRNPEDFDEPLVFTTHKKFRLKIDCHIPANDIVEVTKIAEERLEKPIGALP